MALFFNGSDLPENPPAEYVVWADVMGTRARMSRSLKQTANFVFKLHLAANGAAKAASDGLHVYPVMDGFYACCPKQKTMTNFLRSVFSSVAEEFNQAKQDMHRFMIRGCVAFGPTVHGRNVPDAAFRDAGLERDYRVMSPDVV